MYYENNDQLLQSYDMLLNPKKLKANLILTSLYLTMYETMKSSITDHVQGIFFFNNDELLKERYNSEVLQLCPKDKFRAVCMWVNNNGGLTPDDLTEIQELREKRNKIAHEMPMVISDVRLSIDINWLYRIRNIVAKFDRWWIRHFEIDHVAPDDITDDDIISGNLIITDLIIRTVDGREEELESIYQDWRSADITKNIAKNQPHDDVL